MIIPSLGNYVNSIGYDFSNDNILSTCKVHRRLHGVLVEISRWTVQKCRWNKPVACRAEAHARRAALPAPSPAAIGVLFAVSSLPAQSRGCPIGMRSVEEYNLKNTMLLCALAVTAAFAGQAEAVYKCTTSKGVIYQDRPCKEGTESDVTIVIPTGEMAPKAGSAQDDPTPANVVRQESRFDASKQGRTGDDPASASKSADNRNTTSAATSAADDARKRSARVVESVLPMTADDARKADPTAKYYTTDAAGPGAEVPEHMTCESPTGEKRRFILTNGKLTSI